MRSATVGVVVLVHQDLSRSAQAVQHWAEAGCAVVVHVDRAVTPSAHDRFLQDLSDISNKLSFAPDSAVNGGHGAL